MRSIIQKCFSMTENIAERVKMCIESRLRNITKSVALLYLVSQFTNVIPMEYVVEALWLWLLHHISKQTIPFCFNMWKFWKKKSLNPTWGYYQVFLVFSTFIKWHKLFFIFPHCLFMDFWSQFTFLCALSTSVSEVQHSELDTML